MRRARVGLRYHWPFLVIMPLIIIALSWPTFGQILAGDGFWLVQANSDSNMLFWDAWYFERLITGQADYYFTDLLFHPQGVSLAFHNFSLPQMALMAALKLVLPPDKAFNLTYLLLSFLNAGAGYVYLNYLFRDKWIALFGAVVFGASAFIIARPAHSNIAFIATIPLSLYFLHRGLLEARSRLTLLAGAVIGATAFVGMYSLVCLLIMLGFYVLCFARKNWRERRFWLNLGWLLIPLAGFLALRFYPMLMDPQGLGSALAKNEGREVGNDLIFYLVNFHHPVTSPLLAELFPGLMTNEGWENVVFLGYIPLLLAGWAIARGKAGRWLPWLILGLPFLLLRLGSHLTVNGRVYADIALPKYHLTEALPYLFQPFWATDNFHAGTLLPFAALSCLGLRLATGSMRGRRRCLVILLLSCLAAFEYYQQQRPFELPAGRLDFVEWLKQEEDQASIHLINLPSGGHNSKFYGFYQTYNGYPHAEGRPTRTPARAFDYMEANLLLRHWRHNRSYHCWPGNADIFREAQGQLLADGFTHVVLHRDRVHWQRVAPNFEFVPAAYQDEHVGIFRIADLAESCRLPAFLSAGASERLLAIGERALVPWSRSALLIVDPVEAVDSGAALFNFGGAALLTDQDLAGVGGQPVHQSVLQGSEVILLTLDPRRTAADRVAMYRDWLGAYFNSCGRLVNTEESVIEYFLRRGYACQLALGEAPLAVVYDNGIELGNLLASITGDQLELQLMWKRLPAAAHAFSAQFFDADGAKAHNQDFVFHHDVLGRYEIDLSSLEAGVYRGKLIVYEYASGASSPGRLVGSGAGFERELDFMAFTLD